MRANEMAGQEPLSNRSRPFFRVDMHDGFERDATRTLTPEFTKTVHNTPLLERPFTCSLLDPKPALS